MLCAALFLLLGPVSQDTTPPLLQPDPMALRPVEARVDTRRHEIIIDLPGIPVPMHMGHHAGSMGGFPPVVRFELPVDGSLYGFRVEVVDGSGKELPPQLIHHFNLIDPADRELFLPISRRILAAGKETGPQKLPWFLFGLPVHKGELLVASGMLHNPTMTDYSDVRMRLVLEYVPRGRPWPLWEGYPFQLDVAFPVGTKSFELPPGRSTRFYEGSPAVPGKIVALGGHVHEMATRIELTDVTTDRVIWSASPTLDAKKNVVGVPIGKLYGLGSLGYHISPDRKYRVTVTYDNTTGQAVTAGGMGVIGGLFIPDKDAQWPEANPADSLYRADAMHYLRVAQVSAASGREPSHQP